MTVCPGSVRHTQLLFHTSVLLIPSIPLKKYNRLIKEVVTLQTWKAQCLKILNWTWSLINDFSSLILAYYTQANRNTFIFTIWDTEKLSLCKTSAWEYCTRTICHTRSFTWSLLHANRMWHDYEGIQILIWGDHFVPNYYLNHMGDRFSWP